jgi:hypothetical protein
VGATDAPPRSPQCIMPAAKSVFASRSDGCRAHALEWPSTKSVYAFEQLTRDLEAHGAPDALVAAARDAAWDEVRHARVTTKLAERFGASPAVPVVSPMSARTLLDIALENAAEGCVRETFGALQATYQAAHAKDVSIARAMAVIAEDETRHAALAWDIAAWALPRLSPNERARVDAARRDAVARLEAELASPSDREVTHAAGVPDSVASAWLLTQASAALWSSSGSGHANRVC